MRLTIAFFVAITVAVFGVAVRAQDAPTSIGISDGELTPMGAIRAGDANRFIPAWTGGLTAPVPGEVPGKHPPDPFYEDARWFTVHPQDIDRYNARLSEGLRVLLRRNDGFEIPMYPTRRTAAAPLDFYQASIANLTRARLTNNGLSIEGAQQGVPFPVPKTGIEAMWNHVLRWRGGAVRQTDVVILPDEGGKLSFDTYAQARLSAYNLGIDAPAAVYFLRSGVGADPLDNTVLTLADSTDLIRRPRVVWYRAAGDQRVVPAPAFAYGTPDPATKGIRTADMLDMFSGPLDRFDFKLVGRRMMYAPYNAYKLESPSLDPKEFMLDTHPNPGFLRYEMHRLWVVDATLKRDYRHPYPHRTYYLDEDSWQIVMADHYGPDGALAAYSEAHDIAYGGVPAFVPTLEITYDFKGKRYMVSGFDNQAPPPEFGAKLTPDDFDAKALAIGWRRSY